MKRIVISLYDDAEPIVGSISLDLVTVGVSEFDSPDEWQRALGAALAYFLRGMESYA